MSPVAIVEEPVNGTPKVEIKIPVGPITAARGRKKGSMANGKKDNGCPMGFVRPDLSSRCTWKPNDVKPDLKNGTQGPHTIDET